MSLHIFHYRYYKYIFLKLLRHRGEVNYLSLSVAIGIFCGLLIPLGQIFLAGFIWIFYKKKFSLLIAGSTTFISNPLTMVFLYPFYFWFGLNIFDIKSIEVTKFLDDLNDKPFGEVWKNLDLLQASGDFFFVFFSSALTFATIFGLLSFFICRFLIIKFKKVKKN